MTVTQSPQLDGRSSRRVRAAVILFSGVYGMAVTGLSFLIGRASPPNLWTVGIFQTLFVPIGITALYTAYTVDARAVGFVGLAPVCGALLVASGVLLVGPSLPPLSEIGVGVATVAVITLTPSGAWTVLGYTFGKTLRWRRHATVPRHRVWQACRHITLGSVVVILAAHAALAAWIPEVWAIT